MDMNNSNSNNSNSSDYLQLTDSAAQNYPFYEGNDNSRHEISELYNKYIEPEEQTKTRVFDLLEEEIESLMKEIYQRKFNNEVFEIKEKFDHIKMLIDEIKPYNQIGDDASTFILASLRAKSPRLVAYAKSKINFETVNLETIIRVKKALEETCEIFTKFFESILKKADSFTLRGEIIRSFQNEILNHQKIKEKNIDVSGVLSPSDKRQPEESEYSNDNEENDFPYDDEENENNFEGLGFSDNCKGNEEGKELKGIDEWVDYINDNESKKKKNKKKKKCKKGKSQVIKKEEEDSENPQVDSDCEVENFKETLQKYSISQSSMTNKIKPDFSQGWIDSLRRLISTNI